MGKIDQKKKILTLLTAWTKKSAIILEALSNQLLSIHLMLDP